MLDFKLKVRYIASHIPIYSIGNKVFVILKFLSLNLFINSINDQGPTTVKIKMKVYIINNLRANILIGIGVLKTYSILLDLGI